jgi:site-specific recombinase XerD
MANRDGEPFNNNVLRKFQMCCKRAGIPLRTSLGKLDVHTMRKTFRTIITEDLGASVKVGDFMLGHKGSERSLGTRVYTQVREYRVREVAVQVEDLVLDPNAGPVVGRIPKRA